MVHRICKTLQHMYTTLMLTDSWGTPEVSTLEEEKEPSTITHYEQLLKMTLSMLMIYL